MNVILSGTWHQHTQSFIGSLFRGENNGRGENAALQEHRYTQYSSVLYPLISGRETHTKKKDTKYLNVWKYGNDPREREKSVKRSRCSKISRSACCSSQRSQRRVILRDVKNVGISTKLLEKQVTLWLTVCSGVQLKELGGLGGGGQRTTWNRSSGFLVYHTSMLVDILVKAPSFPFVVFRMFFFNPIPDSSYRGAGLSGWLSWRSSLGRWAVAQKATLWCRLTNTHDLGWLINRIDSEVVEGASKWLNYSLKYSHVWLFSYRWWFYC